MGPAMLVHEGTLQMTNYPVQVLLIVRCSEDCQGMHAVDALSEALADIDSQDPQMRDWTLGFDATLGYLDIDLTIEAEHHADALAHGHAIVRRAGARAYETFPKGHALTIVDSDTEITVFARRPSRHERVADLDLREPAEVPIDRPQLADP